MKSIAPKDEVNLYDLLWTDSNVSVGLTDAFGLTYSLTVSDKTKLLHAPKGYDSSELLEWGITPGLGVNILKELGYTGKNVAIAYVDQSVKRSLHEEYADANLHYYNTVPEGNSSSSMHGPAVLSLLVGSTVGTAPDAEIYYYAHAAWLMEQAPHAACLFKIIEHNESLPEGEKIRMVDFSDNIDSAENNAEEFRKAVDACEEHGI